MHGDLFVYDAEARLAAFQSDGPRDRVLVVLGGLSDGLISLPFLEPLQAALATHGWGLVQALLTSSYSGFGCSTLARDAAEIARLVTHLRTVRGATSVALLGRSTGCQDIVTYLRMPASLRPPVDAVILQAPVSDREYLESVVPECEAIRKDAQALVSSGKPDALLSWKYFGLYPITAERYLSFSGRMTADDMFSSDLTDDDLRTALGHVRAAAPRRLIVWSGSDQYISEAAKATHIELRLSAVTGAELLVFDTANHQISGAEDQRTFAAEVSTFLSRP
eukprot:m51a1_g14458 hypothetical protein (279) ;mRNA; r:654235-655260